MSPLHQAAEQGNLIEVERLLTAAGADVNVQDNEGNTPLHYTAKNGHTEIAKLLIENGADVNAPDQYGRIALHHAAYNAHTEVAELLVSRGAEVNARNEEDTVPLHPAAFHGHTEIVQLLLNRGANVNVPDIYGDTSLHYAAVGNQRETVNLLLDNGADIHAANKYGNTPLSIAAGRGRKEVAELLLDNGAEVNIPYKDGITLLEYFVNCILNPNRLANNTRKEDWIFSSPQCITAVLSSTLPQDAATVVNAIFTNGLCTVDRGILATIVSTNTSPNQKAIFTWTLKQYAELLENPDVQPEQRQQLEDAYKAIITAAVQANPNLYDVAHAYCNPLRDLGRKIRGTAVSLVQSYLTTTDDALHDGIKPTTRNQLLTVVEEAAPQQEQPTRNELLTVAEEAVPPQTSVAESSPEKLNEARETTWEDRTNNTQNHSSTPSR